jgi:preprotein translocase subunit SecA
MRLFGSEKVMSLFQSMGLTDGQQIEHSMLSGAIERAQKKIEGNNFGIRKSLLDYDQVNNEQREIIYDERRRVLDGENMRDAIMKMVSDTIESQVNTVIGSENLPEEWDIEELNQHLISVIPMSPIVLDEEELNHAKKNDLIQRIKETAAKIYDGVEAQFPEREQFREVERVILLRVIDHKWMDHIDDMDQLRQGIGLQSYGQKDPRTEYKFMAFEMFDSMINAISEDTVRALMHVRVEQKVEREEVAKVTGTNKDDTAVQGPVRRTEKKVMPNDPCPCGSGKKYKYCHGRN